MCGNVLPATKYPFSSPPGAYLISIDRAEAKGRGCIGFRPLPGHI